jgi:DNA-binding NtrC family response regulator
MGNVLIVDDEPAIGDYLARLITRLGHQAETTLNASDTLAKLEGGGFQLVIADIRLPDAPDARAWVDQLCTKAGDVPVVLISGAPSNELAECAREHGVAAFLSKPFELAFIKNILQTVFAR